MNEVKNKYWASEKGQQCRRGVNLKRHHGMTLERYAEMFAQQNGKCLICGEPPEPGKNLYVDHDHVTGLRRDLLCRRCNLVLGIVGEDVVILGTLIGYILKHRGLLGGTQCGTESVEKQYSSSECLEPSN